MHTEHRDKRSRFFVDGREPDSRDERPRFTDERGWYHTHHHRETQRHKRWLKEDAQNVSSNRLNQFDGVTPHNHRGRSRESPNDVKGPLTRSTVDRFREREDTRHIEAQYHQDRSGERLKEIRQLYLSSEVYYTLSVQKHKCVTLSHQIAMF